ncbi:helix-turn-helix domain-containing protein [Neorhizobium vignae]|uniref:helix-turn-helix domain-containing protein n=1 Tax=Neorhizobium vignae TaxID=690585 RepID=UPI000A01CAC5|nr:helix-turn-helix domain-containing protein [Neorhizobium vignae]
MNVAPRIQSFCCPTCGGFIGEAAPIEAVIDAQTSPVSKAILTALSSPIGKHMTRDDIVSAVWPRRKPDDPANNFRVTLYSLRKRLTPVGWSIVCERSRGLSDENGSFYRLIPTEARQ